MKTRRTIWLAALAFVCACRPGGDAPRPGTTTEHAAPPEGTAVVFGTLIDLRSGEPASGVEITAPEGKTARSDDHGRFEIGGFSIGACGEVRARAADGREALNRLLPLGRERREIVIFLEAR